MEIKSRLIHSSSFRDSLLSYNHQMNWSQPSSMNYAAALFDSSLLLLEADKPALADAIWKACECDVSAHIPNDGIQHVLDGGALLHHIPWSRGCTYRDICHQYTDSIQRTGGGGSVTGFLCHFRHHYLLLLNICCG